MKGGGLRQLQRIRGCFSAFGRVFCASVRSDARTHSSLMGEYCVRARARVCERVFLSVCLSEVWQTEKPEVCACLCVRALVRVRVRACVRVSVCVVCVCASVSPSLSLILSFPLPPPLFSLLPLSCMHTLSSSLFHLQVQQAVVRRRIYHSRYTIHNVICMK
jgi:hypothetical protein